MCHSTCRDPRPPAPGVARDVAVQLDRLGLSTAAMAGWLADVAHVDRFRDLCYSHADAILYGLARGILADDVATFDQSYVAG